MPTPPKRRLPAESRPPPGRTASILQATLAAGAVLCVAVAALGAGDVYDGGLYGLGFVLGCGWAFLFLTGRRRRVTSDD